MPELFAFLRELRANNDRNWFNANKQRYDYLRQLWLADLQRLIAMMTPAHPEIRGVQARDCAYRIYRDLRFSLDKTPYKTYFSAAIGPQARKTMQSCFYLHFEPDNAGIYFGVWCPEPDKLRAIRALIDAEGDELEKAASAPDFASRFQFMPISTLKSAPAGYPNSHPHITFIRAKDYTFGRQVPDSYYTEGDWASRAAEDFATTVDVKNFLNYVYNP